ncbi:MAG: peptidase domain-containing ABC transporter [Saprospiraceae bacterium]|nr:peptidase domain-containing ABC transporter [Saprospiraceae bacterium]
MKSFPLYRQLENIDCGPSCLRMISAFYGKKYALEELRELCNVTRMGVSFRDINNGAKQIGLETAVVKVPLETLVEEVPLPCILHWRQDHFVVLYGIDKNKSDKFLLADPGFGLIKLNEERFCKEWDPKDGKGVVLIAQPGDNFMDIKPQVPLNSQWKRSWEFIAKYLKQHKAMLSWVAFTLLLGAVISWVFPVLMQKLIDGGVLAKNLDFVWLILLSQFTLFVSKGLIDWIRGVILIRVSMRISVDIISSFIKKLIRLPISFFDTKLHTDILQRIEDQAKIEEFISYRFLSTFFSFINLIVLSALLLWYNTTVFIIFFALTGLAVGWMLLFLERRKYLDYSRFSLQYQDQNNLYELITGMPEIKINGAQDIKVSEWSKIQKKLYELKIRALNLNQQQLLGVDMITQVKNIIVTFICSYFVIQGNMSLGIMMSISYIMGQLSHPVDDLVLFFIGAQDAKLSFDRMDEIQKKTDEDVDKRDAPEFFDKFSLRNLCFKYPGANNPNVLQDINIEIPIGKKTAIVGASGSGKTTLMKLLLKFYTPTSGSIDIDGIRLDDIHADSFRANCGVVMQDGFIYSGTILNNIAIGDEEPDLDKVKWAAKVACIEEFVEGLVLKYNTKIGQTGVDLSGGQKQRLLIARAVYKNPDFLFFDEATSSLDAENEKMIVDNLNTYLQGKTVVVIAHRLSTVQDADQIIVLNQGEVVESGPHLLLSANQGYYYNLIKNQLELGN